MEGGVERDEVPPREVLLEDVGDVPKEGVLDTRVEDSSAIPNNNHIAQPNVASSSLDQDEFPTLAAAASIRKSKRERRQQRPPIPAEFRVGGSPQGIRIPVSFSPIVPAVSASNRSWADVVKPASPGSPTLDSSPKTANVEELGIQPLSPVSPPTSSDPVPLLPDKSVSTSDSASKRTISNWQPSSDSCGHKRAHSVPSQYPNKINRHTPRISLTDRPQNTNTITHSLRVPAILKRFCKSSPNHSTNRLFSSTSKKSLNVDSPSFTPAQLGVKKSNFSTNATPFTPRAAAASANPPLQQDPGASLFKSSPFPEFAPQNNYDLNTVTTTNGSADNGSMGYDPFTMPNVTQALPSTPFNPYAEEHNPLAGAGSSYFPTPNTFSAPSQPLQYHLYQPIASTRETLQPYQRQIYDFFLPPSLREDLQKKSEAARQVLASQPGVQLPSLQQYHSLVPLDTKLRNSTSSLGLSSWVWKATSRKNGNIYCLRRLEGIRLTNEEAIKAVNSWKKIIHPNIVTTVEAFTTREFNDSSLIFVHNYHPLSKTLAEHHFPAGNNRFGRVAPVPEKVLWGYLVQLSSALKAIHKAKLAARCIDINKVILTDKNHIRLSACSILDVLHFDTHRPLEDLQQEDFFHLGRLILGIAANTPLRNNSDLRFPLDQLDRTYSPELKERITWLLTPPQAIATKTADQLVYDLASHVDDMFVAVSNAQDETLNHLGRELENGRLVRLMAKLGTINERPEFDGDPNWSETDQRYTLKLFRDYVFHQVDAQGNPVLDLGHIISCLNKLDAGVEEKIYLTSRDHQSALIVSYKELKKQVNAAFGDLLKAGNKQQATRGY